MFFPRKWRAVLVAFLITAAPLVAQEMAHHHHDGAADERLGTVDSPISCAGSQAAFTRGVAVLHS